MKYIFILLLLCIAISCKKVPPEPIENLGKRFASAIQSQDRNALKELCNASGMQEFDQRRTILFQALKSSGIDRTKLVYSKTEDRIHESNPTFAYNTTIEMQHEKTTILFIINRAVCRKGIWKLQGPIPNWFILINNGQILYLPVDSPFKDEGQLLGEYFNKGDIDSMLEFWESPEDIVARMSRSSIVFTQSQAEEAHRASCEDRKKEIAEVRSLLLKDGYDISKMKFLRLKNDEITSEGKRANTEICFHLGGEDTLHIRIGMIDTKGGRKFIGKFASDGLPQIHRRGYYQKVLKLNKQ